MAKKKPEYHRSMLRFEKKDFKRIEKHAEKDRVKPGTWMRNRLLDLLDQLDGA